MNKTFFTSIAAVLIYGYAASASAALVADARPISGQGTWETTLQARDLDGDLTTAEAYYDTVLNITWLADASLGATNNFGVTGVNSNGSMNKPESDQWIANMNTYGGTGYLGINGWRLPDFTDLPPLTGCNNSNYVSYSGSDCGFNVDTASGELAHMFQVTLGNQALWDTAGNQRAAGTFGATNTCFFYNLVFEPYWYADVYEQNTNDSWYFNYHYGKQNHANNTSSQYFVWAVHDGSIGTALVPVPAAVWLFGSGLLGLAGIARRNKTS